jgi:hypothetical protein
MEMYINNQKTTINEIVEEFCLLLEEWGAVSLQPYTASIEMFSARKIEHGNVTQYIIGNTFCDDRVDTVLASDGSCLVDFRRTDVVGLKKLRNYLKKLVTNWVETSFQEGSFMATDRSEEEERELIMKEMIYWNDASELSWPYSVDYKDIWINQSKIDREKLYEE